MLENAKNLFENYKNLLSNLGYLSLLKFFNLILPLVIYPYLIHVLGADKYGLVVFAEAIVAYLVIFIGFGFEISGTKAVSIHRNNTSKLSEIVSSLFIIKGLIFAICAIALFVILSFFPQLENNKILLFLTMHMALFEFMFPFWFFQGLEKMKYIAYLNLVSRLLFLVLIFVLIKSPKDYLMVPVIQGLGSLVVIVISWFIVFFKKKIRFYFPSFEILKGYFNDGLLYFTSTLSIQIFTNSNRFLIGSFMGMTNLAFYDIVEKIIRICTVPTTILRLVLLPFVIKTKDKLVVRYTTVFMSIMSVIIIGLIWIFSDQIIHFVTGERDALISYHLKIYAIIILMYNLSNYYLVISFNAFGFEKKFVNLMVKSLVLYILLILGLVGFKFYSITNFILILIGVEIFIVANTYRFSIKNNLL